MVVKDRVGRKRYIAFEAPTPPPSRRRLERAVDEALDGARPCRLTVYEAGFGILRVAHVDAAAAREVLDGLGARTLVTSGTIRKAKERAGLVGGR